MIDQEDKRLHPTINKYGCYFLSILWHCRNLAGNPTTPEEINAFFGRMTHAGYLDGECTVLFPEHIFEALGPRVTQLKTLEGSVKMPVTETVMAGFEILCYSWPEMKYTHFCPGDGYGKLAYDPIKRGSNTVKNGRVTSKRLFAIV